MVSSKFSDVFERAEIELIAGSLRDDMSREQLLRYYNAAVGAAGAAAWAGDGLAAIDTLRSSRPG